MKRFVSFILALAMLLSLVACGSGDKKKDDAKKENSKKDEKVEAADTTAKKEEADAGIDVDMDENKPVELIYPKEAFDGSNYRNIVTINNAYVDGSELYVEFTPKEYNGDGYNVFSTDIVMYDNHNRIVDIKGLFVSTFDETVIGKKCTDRISVVDGVSKIVIMGNNKTSTPVVAMDHGETDIELVIPSTCKDNYNYGNTVSIDSYNVHGDELFFAYTVTAYNGEGFDSVSTDCAFYDEKGRIIDLRSVMYTTNITDDIIGYTYFDKVDIPEGTKKIVVLSNNEEMEPVIAADHGSTDISFVIPKICMDSYNYRNTVEVKSYNVYDGEMYITYTVTAHNGDGFDSFSVPCAIFDENDRVIDVRSLMYTTNISDAVVGYSYFDSFSIPEGAKKIVVFSSTKDTKPVVAKDHGDTSISMQIPQYCYDEDDCGCGVRVDSYNVHDGELFMIYTVTSYCSEEATYATEATFYDGSGAEIDDRQVMYTSNITKSVVGNTYIESFSLPEGTARIVIEAHSSGGGSLNVGGNYEGDNDDDYDDYDDHENEEVEDPTLWVPDEIQDLFDAASAANGKSRAALNKVLNSYDYKMPQYALSYMLMAKSEMNSALYYLKKAEKLLSENKSVPITNDNYSTALAYASAAVKECEKYANMELTLENFDSLRKDYEQGAMDAMTNGLGLMAIAKSMLEGYLEYAKDQLANAQ